MAYNGLIWLFIKGFTAYLVVSRLVIKKNTPVDPRVVESVVGSAPAEDLYKGDWYFI